MNRYLLALMVAMALLLNVAPVVAQETAAAAAPAEAQSPPFNYLEAEAYHILPETHNNESGYFSLAEGIDGKLYIGTAKYGENAYLVEFDPRTEEQRIVIDTNALTGATGRGFASQSKIHTKNYVGPSGRVYVGSKQGYETDEDKANKVQYPGGYVMIYDPSTDTATSLGMPFPGEGINDVVADEERGLIYVITCEEQHWMVYDENASEPRWRALDAPLMYAYASTLVDEDGKAHTITADYKLATYDPETDKVSVRDISVDGRTLALPDAPRAERHSAWIPSMRLAPDGRSAYVIRLGFPDLYRIELPAPNGEGPAQASNLGKMIDSDNSDCRSGLDIGPDGKVYAVIAVVNRTGWGTGHQLNHLTRYDPEAKRFEDLGVLVVKNPDFFDFEAAGPDGKPRPFTHGYQTLPDGTLTPQYQHLGAIVARDGTVYTLILYPYTLLRLETSEYGQSTAAAAR